MGKQSYRVCFCFRRWFHVGVSEPPEAIESLFNQYSENGIMTVDHLHRFLVEVQKERNPKKEDAQAIIDSMDDQLNLKHPHSSDQRKGLNLEAFFKYLLSEKNSPLCPSRGVHQDMKAPLSHYFIYTGHNSYLTGNQLNSKCSAGPIKDALKSGLRGIELDLWPSSKKKDGVEVCHGGTLTAPVDLTTCLETIKKYAFDASEYPVVITFEDHLPPNLQDKVAELVTGIFDKKDLLTADSDGSECLTEFPSPESLKGKIIISTKPPEDKAKDKENELPKSTSCHVNFPPFMKMFNHRRKKVCGQKAKHQEYPRPSASSSADEAEWGEEVPNLKGIVKTTNGSTNDKDYSDEEGSTNADGDSGKTQQNVVEAPKYRHLISMHAGKPKGGLKEWLKVEVDRVRRLSLSELQLERAVTKKYGQDIVRFTQSNVLRVYPKGLRIDSSNYNPLIAWSHGAQMVAFNMQGYGRPLWLMHGMFRANGGCGYVKKPEFLLEKTGLYRDLFDPEVNLPVKTTLKVTLYSGEGWDKEFHHTYFDACSPPDFYAKVGIAGVPGDTSSMTDQTEPIKDSWVPAWNKEFKFQLTVPELALLRIEIHERDDILQKDDFGGQTCLPVSELRQGIRAVPLHDRKGNEYKNVKLLMSFELI